MSDTKPKARGTKPKAELPPGKELAQK